VTTWALALGLVAASLSARVEAAPGPRLAEAERKERALGRDPKKLRFRSNIEVVVAAWRDAGRGASGEELIAAMEGELRGLELLAHWSGTADDRRRRDKLKAELAERRAELAEKRARPRGDGARGAARDSARDAAREDKRPERAGAAKGLRTLAALDWELGEGVVELALPKGEPLDVRRELLAGTRGVFFDLKPLVAAERAIGATRLDHPLVAKVRVGQFRADTVRIVIEPTEGAFASREALLENVRVLDDGGRLVLRVTAGQGLPTRVAARDAERARPSEGTGALTEATTSSAAADPRAALADLQRALDALDGGAPRSARAKAADAPRGKDDADAPARALDRLVEQLRLHDPDEPRAAADAPASASPRVTPPEAPAREEAQDDGPPPAGVTVGLAKSTRDALATRGRGGVAHIRRVVIDAGHGGKDTGAIGKAGTREKDVNLAIAKELARVLQEKLGVEVVMTRTKDTYVSLGQRVQAANRADADLFVSVHSNAHRNRKFSGIETYYLNTTSNRYAKRLAARENAEEWDEAHLDVGDPTEPMRDDDTAELPTGSLGQDLRLLLADLAMRSATEESRRLAGLVQSTLVQSLRRSSGEVVDLGVKHALFYVLLGSRMPSILIESGFLSHPEEERRLADPAYQRKLAHAVASAIQRYVEDRGQVATRK
jgi:N-acetylmuramoyl-L-alanine amidase